MNRLKIILSYILGFALTISLFLLAGLLIVKNTILDKSFMFRLMDENNYYSNVYKSICEDIEDYMTSSGLEKEILDGVISKNKVEKDIVEYTNGLYSNTKYEVSTVEIKDKLKNNINHYLKDLNLGIDNTNELDLFISDIEDIYKEEVSFYNTLDITSSIINKLNNMIDKVLLAVIICTVILIILVLLLRVVNIGSCILGSGIILFIIRLFIYERVDFENILLVSDHFSLIIRSMFKYISNYMISISVILVCIGFIFSLINFRKKVIEKK